MASILKLSTKANKKCTVVIKPIAKHIFTSTILLFLERVGQIIDVTRRRNTLFATFSTSETAALAVSQLNNQSIDNTMVTVELYTHAFFSATPEKEVLITWAKKDDASAKETKKNNAATIPLPIIPSKSKSKSKPSKSKSSSFFTGQHLITLLQIAGNSTNPRTTALVRLLTKKRTNHAKEISESFGATKALFDYDQKYQLNLRKGNKKVVVFVPGDGCKPYTSAALLLQTPQSWTCISIDPALKTNKTVTIDQNEPRLCIQPIALEEMDLTEPSIANRLNEADAIVVLAVHSHAPLQSFWSKLPANKLRICVSIPCCGDYGWLSTNDLKEKYIDYEIESQANTILVYTRKKSGENTHTHTHTYT